MAPEKPPESFGSGRRVATGALVNALGAAGKALFPLFLIVITRQYGPASVGVFLLLYTLLEMTRNLTVGGLGDATLMYLTRSRSSPERQYQLLASALLLALASAIVVVALGALGGVDILAAHYAHYPDMGRHLRSLLWVIPVALIPTVAISATKALHTMKWDALNTGLVQPGVLLAASVTFGLFDLSITSLVRALELAFVASALFAIAAMGKYFSLRQLARALRHPRVDWPMLGFALPQNLNMAFTVFMTNVDLLMLGAMGLRADQIALYGVGANIVRNLRQVKLIFARAYAPAIVALHTDGHDEALSRSYSMVSRWIATIGLPAALLVALLRGDLLRLFHPSFTDSTAFMLPLLVPPLISMTVGLSANILVMTGHTGYNLANSITAAVANIGLNYFFIPRLGLTGAAIATALTSVLNALITNIEVWALHRTRPVVRLLYKPYVAIALPTVLFVLLLRAQLLETTTIRLLIAPMLAGLYLLAYRVLGMEPEDRQIFSRSKMNQR